MIIRVMLASALGFPALHRKKSGIRPSVHSVSSAPLALTEDELSLLPSLCCEHLRTKEIILNAATLQSLLSSAYLRGMISDSFQWSKSNTATNKRAGGADS